MFVFLDESFRENKQGERFGVLGGIAVPDDAVMSLRAAVHAVRRPYHDRVLRADDEIKGSELLRRCTFRVRNRPRS